MLETEKLAIEIRETILTMAFNAQASHIASSLSSVDLLAVFYHQRLSSLSAESQANQDLLVFSKGHAAMAQYSALATFGLLDKNLLKTYGKEGSILSGHVSHTISSHIPLSTGSLGHGLPYGLGLAIAEQLNGNTNRVFVLMSDGEMDEGTTWESALIAKQFNLQNLTVIIDRNRIQSLSETEKVLALEPLADKWRSFNWEVVEIDGHSHEEIAFALNGQGGPLCIIANTVKGHGVSFMENKVLWHYRPPNEAELELALQEVRRKLL